MGVCHPLCDVVPGRELQLREQGRGRSRPRAVTSERVLGAVLLPDGAECASHGDRALHGRLHPAVPDVVVHSDVDLGRIAALLDEPPGYHLRGEGERQLRSRVGDLLRVTE